MKKMMLLCNLSGAKSVFTVEQKEVRLWMTKK